VFNHPQLSLSDFSNHKLEDYVDVPASVMAKIPRIQIYLADIADFESPRKDKEIDPQVGMF
jgi:hypothetical protein